MSFYNDNDLRLDQKLDEIKAQMEEALTLIDACDNDRSSDFNTQQLKKSIERFLDDYK